MRIIAQSTITATEVAIRTLWAEADDEPLIMPSQLTHMVGGADAAVVQAIITWAQRSARRQISTFMDEPTQADKFVQRLPTLVAGLCARVVAARNGDTNLTTPFRKAALNRLDVLQGVRPRGAFRGPSAEVVCADHLGRSAPYLFSVPDERGGARLRPRENFKTLARWLLDLVVPKPYRNDFDLEASDAIGAMLFELFKNTEDHALVDAGNDLLEISIRGLATKHHSLSPDILVEIVQDYTPLASYCETLAPPEGAVHTHIFELSVFDSGPGFATSWTKRALHALTLEEEEQAVRRCFGVGSAKGHDRFGQGLPHVLKLLQKQRGFLRLRTGRLSFYADFSKPDVEGDLTALQRYDSDDGDALGAVSGSLLTILIPMRR